MHYIIENDYLLAEIAELGATLVKLVDKSSGVDIVLGFDSDEDYLKYAHTNMGATVGRNCNRIGNAKFRINDEEYQLTINDNMNQLHGGGINGFAFQNWDLIDKQDDSITLSYFSKDLEEGFPGNLTTTVTYKLEDNNLLFIFTGNCDKDTLFNISNHSYFNLGDDSILDEYLKIYTDTYAPTDEYALTLDETLSVAGTPYDFREFTLIGDNLKQLDNGIDNDYVFENLDDKLMASLKNNNLQLNIYSDLPVIHIYTSCYLNGEIGKKQKAYKQSEGICFECHYFTNGINYDGYLVPILRKDEDMTHYIRYEIEKL